MKYDVFISYSWRDKETARVIYEKLIRCGFTVFFDEKTIPAGGSFPKVVAENILSSNVFLYLGSRNSYNSGWAPEEFTFAKNHKERSKILFYAIDDSPRPNWLDFASGVLNRRNSRDHSLDVIVHDIHEMIGIQSVCACSSKSSSSLQPTTYNDEGERYLQGRQYPKAIDCFKRGIDIGDANAMYNLGSMYMNNIYVHNKKIEGVDLVLQAAKAGLSKARRLLIEEANRDATFVKRFMIDIKTLLEEEAETGDKKSQYDLALMYQHGSSVIMKDKQRAMYWFKKCIEYKDARMHLCWLQSN